MRKHFIADMYPKGFVIEVGESLILCPVCKDQYTHVGYRPEVNLPESYLDGHRGGGITIPMSCEHGHHWDVIISHHKGNSYITTTNFKKDITN